MLRKDIKKRPLSEKTLTSLKPEEKDYRELDSLGLYFLVKKSGVKNWQYRYKNTEGKWAWMGLGAYPQVSAQLARQKAREFTSALSKGESLKSKKVLLEERKELESFYFENLMREWLDTKSSKWGEATYTKAQKSIEKHIIPVFGQGNYKEITPKEWFDFFQGLQRTLGIHTQIEKLVSYVRGCYDWAKFKGKINSNPIEGMSKHLDAYESGNMDFVTVDELPALLKKIRNNKKRAIGIGLELLIMLFPRPGELRMAKWEQFDFKKALWTKPAEMTKTRQEHQVPLSKQVITLLTELRSIQPESEFLFPSRLSVNKTISDMTFNLALRRLGYQGKQDPHGFRHLASTILNDKFSNQEQVIEVCLAHKKKGVKGVYDKSQHLDERLKNSGNLIAFEYRNIRWELEPKTAFYDWIYLNALNLNDDLKQQALAYDAFTDIEFNPQKSINCQAYSIALFVALTKRNLLEGGLIPPKDEFITLIEQFTIKNTSDGLLF